MTGNSSPADPSGFTPETGLADAPVSGTFEILNQRGLHARAAAKFVKVAESFSADILVTRNDITVTARSIMGLMMLAAGRGTTITIRATGPDAAPALQALAELLDRRFDED